MSLEDMMTSTTQISLPDTLSPVAGTLPEACTSVFGGSVDSVSVVDACCDVEVVLSVLNNDDSFQYINFDGKKEGDKVNYGILGMHELVSAINKSKYVSKVYANGFEGKPSSNTVTNHKKLLFISSLRYTIETLKSQYNLYTRTYFNLIRT